MNFENRLSNLEKAVAEKAARQDTGQAVAWAPSEPVPELPADATPAQRKLHAELSAMNASIPNPEPLGA